MTELFDCKAYRQFVEELAVKIMGWHTVEHELPYTRIAGFALVDTVWVDSDNQFVMSYESWCPFSDLQFDMVWAKIPDDLRLCVTVGDGGVSADLELGGGLCEINNGRVMHAMKTAIFKAALEAVDDSE